MSAVLSIAWREVRERRVLLIAAAVFGLAGLVLGGVPGSPRARDLGETLTIVLFMAFVPAVALAVGSSLVGRDLAERRLSFYFSRPLSAGALWAGKFLGGATLVLGAFVCFLVPFTLATGGIAAEGIAAWLLLLLCLMALAHVITAMYRSGSKLFALDLGLGALSVTVFVAQVRHLVTAGAGLVLCWEPLGVIGMAMVVATIAMMTAAAAQLVYGRADAHRGHVALSAATWTFTLAALSALALWSGWLLDVTPADVGGVGHPLLVAPRGNALLFKGASWQGHSVSTPFS